MLTNVQIVDLTFKANFWRKKNKNNIYFKISSAVNCTQCAKLWNSRHWNNVYSGGGWVRQKCRVSCVTRASKWYWLIVGQNLLSLQQVWVGVGDVFVSFVYSLSFIFLFRPCLSLSSPLLSLFSLSLEDDKKWPTKVDVSLNHNTLNQKYIQES